MTPSRLVLAIAVLCTLSDNTQVSVTGWLILTGYALLHFGLLLAYPFKNCRACKGAGHHQSKFLRAYRTCHRCGGTGKTLRTGRKALNAATRVRRARRAAANHRRDQVNGGT
ncbi:hypothetical protein [Saccharothrix sp.]|uniref:hypothetical protein n=1 Tax=Saccharothrix sp. TaxID=1873460 RepID=UPI0028126CBC|nr:hypothetical protein [Saccharothrix sp.]